MCELMEITAREVRVIQLYMCILGYNITDLCAYTLHAMFANMKPIMFWGNPGGCGHAVAHPISKMCTFHVDILPYVPTCRIKHCDACI